jgi:gamma-glutamyltranspeptidase/glutathione hydrolase
MSSQCGLSYVSNTGSKVLAIALRSIRVAAWLGVIMVSPVVALRSVNATEPNAPNAPNESTSLNHQPVQANTAMVTAAHPLASQAGVMILQAGGNAIDAAIASAFAISVLEPYSAGIGGGGFLLIYDAETREVRSLDFRERAPIAATPNMYLDANGEPIPDSRSGHRAVAVPGTVAGLYEAHQRYGQLPWAEVVQPAIDLAASGFEVSDRFVQSLNWRASVLLSNPAARAVFSRDETGETPQLYALGDRFVQPDLAATLQRLADDPEDFYHGETAAAIVADMAANGGLITQTDLDQYEPIWRDPVCGLFQPQQANSEQFQVCAMAPPSSGGVHLLQMLTLLEPFDLANQSARQRQHLLTEAMKIAYADRAYYLGDPDFVDVPVAELIHPEYLDRRRAEIEPDRARSAEEVQAADPALLARLATESRDTSHLSVVDGDRNAASLTFTVNGGFGAGIVAAGTGIVFNNEMDDFSIAPGVPNLYGLIGGEANAIAARKTPLSSMTPTIVTDTDANLRLVVGSPGGSTIITTVVQILLNALVYDQNVATAIAAPRLHHQWQPDTLRLEADFDPAIVRDLQTLGHVLMTGGQWGNASAIEVIPNHAPSGSEPFMDYLEGATDPRGNGVAQGF